jgi:hypothetical protein
MHTHKRSPEKQEKKKAKIVDKSGKEKKTREREKENLTHKSLPTV